MNLPFKIPLYFTHHAKRTRHTLDPHIAKPPAKIISINFEYAISSPYLRCRETTLSLYDGDVYVDVRLNGQHDEKTLSYGDLSSLNEN